MIFKVNLVDYETDVNLCIAQFADFTTLLCCVPSICLMLHQKGYKSQDLELFISDSSFFNISLSNFKPNQKWTINTMTCLQRAYSSFIVL